MTGEVSGVMSTKLLREKDFPNGQQFAQVIGAEREGKVAVLRPALRRWMPLPQTFGGKESTLMEQSKK